MDGGGSWQNTMKIGLPVIGGEKRCLIYLFCLDFDSLSSETVAKAQRSPPRAFKERGQGGGKSALLMLFIDIIFLFSSCIRHEMEQLQGAYVCER